MDSRFQVLIPNRKWLVKAAAVSVVAHFAVLGGYLVLGERVKEVVHSITFEPPPPPSACGDDVCEEAIGENALN